MRTSIDLESVKIQADLLAICGSGTQLKKAAATNGGEWSGPCPMCGGRDRFRVQPYAKPYPLWLCRHCTGGKWDTVIGYLALHDGLDPKRAEDLAEICRRAVGEVPTINGPRPVPPPAPAYQAPASDWQRQAREVISECESALWLPKYAKVLDYLHGRGLRDETIRHFRLGYCSTGKADIYGREISGLYIPRGLLIPCLAGGRVWYLKIRLVPGVPCRCQKEGCKAIMASPGRCPKCGEDTRYLGVKGNKTAAIYNADALPGATMALFCEGEFDCMIAYQEFGRVMPAATIGGSSSNRLDLATWGAYLLSLQSILVTYDADPAGEDGIEWWSTLSDRVRLAPLPAGVKDINDFHQEGGNLVDWITNYQAFYSDPFFIGADLVK